MINYHQYVPKGWRKAIPALIIVGIIVLGLINYVALGFVLLTGLAIGVTMVTKDMADWAEKEADYKDWATMFLCIFFTFILSAVTIVLWLLSAELACGLITGENLMLH